MRTFVLHAPVARRAPDPVVSTRGERHVLFCKVCEMPEGIPLDPNPRRTQKLDRMVYREVAQTLRNEIGEPDTFHLKNKGITIIAAEIQKLEDDRFVLVLDEGHGILDGGHTYRLIREAVEKGECPSTQYVKVEVLVKYDPRLTEEIAEGLNSSVQVQEKTLADQRRQFDWIKDALKGTHLIDFVAFRENEPSAYDIREIVALLTMFNPARPNGQDHPISAFMSKESTLAKYLADEGDPERPGDQTFRRLRPILVDILLLQEIVASEAGEIHNKKNGGRAGGLAIIDYNEKKDHYFPFIERETPYRLRAGALYPTLAAFRYLVEVDALSGTHKWRTKGGFEEVVDLWRAAAPELIRNLVETSADVNYSVSQLGKHKTLWTSQYNTLKATFLERQG